MRWSGRDEGRRFWEWGGDRTRAECGVLFNALFLFEGMSLEGERKRYRRRDNIYTHFTTSSQAHALGPNRPRPDQTLPRECAS